MRISIAILLITILSNIALSQDNVVYLDINKPSLNVTVWQSKNHLLRVWDNEKYLFVDPFGLVVLDMKDYSHVDDFKNGYSVVQSNKGKYGVIDMSGKLVIDTVWTGCMQSSHYFAVGKGTGSYLEEDRGEGGVKSYPVLDWHLLNEKGEALGGGFKNLTIISNWVMAQTASNQDLVLNLDRINFGYYHPLMKAIEKLDGQQVRFSVDENAKKINYYTTDDRSSQYTLNFRSQ